MTEVAFLGRSNRRDSYSGNSQWSGLEFTPGMGKGRGEGRQRLAKAGRDHACTRHRAGSPLRRLLDGFLGQRNLEACALGSWFCCLTAHYATQKQSHHWPTHLYVTSSLNYEKWQWSLKGSLLETTAAPGYSRYFPDSSTTSATGDPPHCPETRTCCHGSCFSLL